MAKFSRVGGQKHTKKHLKKYPFFNAKNTIFDHSGGGDKGPLMPSLADAHANIRDITITE